jgi:hypothetical protein
MTRDAVAASTCAPDRSERESLRFLRPRDNEETAQDAGPSRLDH